MVMKDCISWLTVLSLYQTHHHDHIYKDTQKVCNGKDPGGGTAQEAHSRGTQGGEEHVEQEQEEFGRVHLQSWTMGGGRCLGNKQGT